MKTNDLRDAWGIVSAATVGTVYGWIGTVIIAFIVFVALLFAWFEEHDHDEEGHRGRGPIVRTSDDDTQRDRQQCEDVAEDLKQDSGSSRDGHCSYPKF